MSDFHSSVGPQGAGGTATARAREQRINPDEKARKNRIAELRRQYLEGTYQVDARELSVALLNRHLAKEGVITP